jgi:hypothetical protein
VQEPDVISCPSRKGLPRWTQCHASQATERQNSCGAGQWIEVRRELAEAALRRIKSFPSFSALSQ